MRKEIEKDEAGNTIRNPDGSARIHYHAEEGEVAYFTGPIAGLVELPTGQVYDVGDEVIAVHPDHVQSLHLAIHKEHHAAGRFLDVPLPTA